MNTTLTLIQNLRQQESQERAVLQEAEAKYGSSYPKLPELRANLAPGLQIHACHLEEADPLPRLSRTGAQQQF